MLPSHTATASNLSRVRDAPTLSAGVGPVPESTRDSRLYTKSAARPFRFPVLLLMLGDVARAANERIEGHRPHRPRVPELMPSVVEHDDAGVIAAGPWRPPRYLTR